MRKLNHNRPICSGDCGPTGYLPGTSARQREIEDRQDITLFKRRMANYTQAFIHKIYTENTNPLWRKAAEEMLLAGC